MKPIDVLFLCETNAATSLMAEAVANHRANGQLRAFSAGRVPGPSILSDARNALLARAIPVDGLEPKSWSIFSFAGARKPDLIVDLATVTWTLPEVAELSDHAVLRWPLRDPALVEDRRERRAVTETVLKALIARIDDELVSRRPGLIPTGGARNRPAALLMA